MKNLITAVIDNYYKLERFCPEHELLKYLIREEDNRLQINDDTLNEFMGRFGPNFDRFFEENKKNINFYELFVAVTYNRYYMALEKQLSFFNEISMN